VGYVPASRPALLVLVSLDSPRGARNQGGDVAAPLFARITEQALRRLSIPPDDPERVLRALDYRPPTVVPASYTPQEAAAAERGEPGLMPDLRGRSAREAAIAAARRGLIVELTGTGKVISQTPEPGAEIEPGMTCRLSLTSASGSADRGSSPAGSSQTGVQGGRGAGSVSGPAVPPGASGDGVAGGGSESIR
jgi:hypothetical protein